MSSENQITCQVCHTKCHVIKKHLENHHPEISLEQYQGMFPMAPLLSPKAEAALAERSRSQSVVTAPVAETRLTAPLHEVFGFGNIKEAMNSSGGPINIQVQQYGQDDGVQHLVPDVDRGYIHNPELVKSICMALEMNIPFYLFGHAGVGKSTAIEQVCAHTKRGYVRVQHTANMEEADVEGRWIVNAKGEMVFQLGPLAEAMRDGLTYCADEYDFAPPMVLSVYQAVLEGKPLFIKAANLKINPHRRFRFAATGNTNGAGDESGLYQGTMIQNAASYERFGIFEKVNYMPKKDEIALLVAKAGVLTSDAEKLVDFATMTREAFDRKEMAIPMSPRSLLMAAKTGAAKKKFAWGIERAYLNRLPEVSRAVGEQIVQRLFG
jgi:cobaltochelatase CobS